MNDIDDLNERIDRLEGLLHGMVKHLRLVLDQEFDGSDPEFVTPEEHEKRDKQRFDNLNRLTNILSRGKK